MKRDDGDLEVQPPGRRGRQTGSATDAASDVAALEKSGKDTRVLAGSSTPAATGPRASLRDALTELQQANAERDADRSHRAARDLRYKLERARDATPESGDATNAGEVEREAAPHLKAAFHASSAALDALAAGDTSIYKREAATWRGDSNVDATAPESVAGKGVRSPGGALPFLSQIQRHFGSHDITKVRAHLGGGAAASAQQLGARAFAMGSDVAFAATPDLHTAAHEAAHVVQQRSGVALAGGIDRPGDIYEQQADRVADAVVRGESAAPLLDEFAGQGGGPNNSAATVQRKTDSSIEVPDALKLKPEQQTGSVGRPANTGDAKADQTPEAATRGYLKPHVNHLWNAARAELASTSWPSAERFAWKDPRAFSETVLAGVHDHVMQHSSKGDIDLAPFDELLHPLRIANELGPMVPYEQKEDETTAALTRAANMVNQTVPAEKKGYVKSISATWVPAVGLRFAQLLKNALMTSTPRMTSRYVDAMNDRARAGLTAHDADVRLTERDLITSRPIDRFVARALVAPSKGGTLVGEVVPDASVKATERTTLRRPKLTWEGTRDKRFWCWVRADIPDATPEEVAAVLFAYLGGEPRTYLAYGFAQVGPLFGLPASWAIQFPEARDSAPESVRQGKLPDPESDTIANRMMLVAGSDQADAIALDQAAKKPVGADVDVAKVLAANEDIILQLAALQSALTPWGLAGDLIPIVMRAVTKRDTLRTAPANEVMAYAAVAISERERLTRISGSIANTIAAGKQFAGHDAENPVHAILTRYAQAAATAQLADVSESLITEAQTMQRGLVIKSLQANQLAAMQAMDAMHAGPAMRDPKAPVDDRDFFDKTIDDLKGNGPAQRGAAKTSSAAARQLGAMYNDAQDRARVLENTLLQGGDVDADELQRVQLESQEVALRARIENLNAQLDLVADEAAAAENAGISAKLASLGSGKFRGLRDMTVQLRAQLVEVRRDLLLDPKAAKPKQGDGDGLTPPPVDVSAKRDALTKAQGRFDSLSRDYELHTYMERAYSLIDDQRFRTTLVNVAALIGFSFAGSGLASTITKGVERALVTAEGVQNVAQLSLAARGGIFAMRVATETLANASGQVVMSGDSVGKALAENALLTVGMEATSAVIAKDVATARAFSKAFAEQVSRIESIEARAAMRASSAGTVAKLVGREAIGISGHAIMGMALGSISHELLTHLDGQGQAQSGAAGDVSTDAIIQAASVAVGRLVHARIEQRRAAIDTLARKSGTAEGQQLGAHARQLEDLSTQLASRPAAERAEAALEVLEHQWRLIDEEIRVIDQLLSRADHGGYSADELARTKAELVGQRNSAGDMTMLTVQFHLVGLRELAPGTMWSGTPAEVAQAVERLQAAQPDAQVRETAPGVTKAKVGDREIVFHSVADARAAGAARAGDTSAVDSLTSSLPVLDQVELATGVQKGPAYDRDMADLRQFYADQEREAQQGVANSGVTRDGQYGWRYGNRAFTFSHGVVNFEVRVHLDTSNVTPADAQKLKSQVHAGIDRYYNTKKLMVRGPDGAENRLHLEVVFVDDIALSDIQVTAKSGDGVANINEWYVDGKPTTHAHEVTHGGFGIKDEYYDATGGSPDRDALNAPGVHDDHSIMGDYWDGDWRTGADADPRTSVKQRHLDEISPQVPPRPQQPGKTSSTNEQGNGGNSVGSQRPNASSLEGRGAGARMAEGFGAGMWGEGRKPDAPGKKRRPPLDPATKEWAKPVRRPDGQITSHDAQVNYHPLDEYGRATGVDGTLTPEMVGTGTEANRDIDPPGWKGHGTIHNQARGHLLANILGGSGNLPENLVTLQQNWTNTPVMRDFEKQVKRALERGETVHYSSKPLYDGANPLPRGVSITADGNGGFHLAVTILNPPGMKDPVPRREIDTSTDLKSPYWGKGRRQ